MLAIAVTPNIERFYNVVAFDVAAYLQLANQGKLQPVDFIAVSQHRRTRNFKAFSRGSCCRIEPEAMRPEYKTA